MKKYICILAGAALLAACEQKTETVTPATSPTPTTPPPATTEVTSPAATEAPAATTDSPAGTEESPAGTEETPAESPVAIRLEFFLLRSLPPIFGGRFLLY